MAEATPKNLLQRAIPALKLIAKAKQLTIVLLVVAIMAIIIVPLPTVVLDFFLTVSIAIAVLMILIAFYTPRPTDLTTFPTLLLIVTLYRLALNVATTRMILSEGHNGPEAVSHIVAAFGNFVVGGNFVIGTIVFTILVLINFMVITKGSGRVAEVAARFTLDAMPGKQMAIDADLNAGMIDEPEARRRRQEIVAEANFYGAMDGASKFISGDAVAGIIITVVNIIGGFLIGVFQHDLTVKASASTYTILTIGDGLVAQLPALIISTSVGIIITRATKADSESAVFTENIVNQLIQDYKVLLIVGSILMMFAMIPGLPTFSLGFVGLCFLGLGYMMLKEKHPEVIDKIKKSSKKPQMRAEEELDLAAATEAHKATAAMKPQKSAEEIRKEEEEALEDILKVELLELNVGYGLIRLADANQGGDLLERIRGMRRKIALDYGFVMPQVRIRDNLQLPSNSYEVMLKGVPIGSGEIYPEKFLAMNSGLVTEEIAGIATKEPAFGLDAIWIEPEEKEDALMKGYTVVDPSTVVATHMSELVKKHAEELLTRQDVLNLIEKLKKDYPAVVEDCLKVASIGTIQRVLKQLLHEKIPIKDMLTIMESISDTAEYTKSVEVLVEQVRARLARVITGLYKSDDGTLKLLTFNNETEQRLLDKTRDQNGTRSFLLNVGEINALVNDVSDAAKSVLERGVAPVIIVVEPMIRKSLSEIFERFGLDIVVLSHAEIEPTAKFEVLGSVAVNFP
ncbi:MAG: flagellar biosynthesis protein FlhA [Campylobacteraceae bacterium]|nr:flagellar biosynthesis protein FlhA [Campylobacteraceae bacterium]